MYIYSEGFNAFENPTFLENFLQKNSGINGILKVDTNLIKVPINKVYDS
jgi:hypothetical protein